MSQREGVDEIDDDLVAGLVDAISSVRRVTMRALRDVNALEQLSLAESQLLQIVSQNPGLGVAEAASMLRLAPNTVSTLVGALVRAGRIERRTSPQDRRMALLEPTDAGRRYMSEWQAQRQRVMAEALADLEPADLAAIAAAVAPLHRLAEVIAERVEEEAVEPS